MEEPGKTIFPNSTFFQKGIPGDKLGCQHKSVAALIRSMNRFFQILYQSGLCQNLRFQNVVQLFFGK